MTALAEVQRDRASLVRYARRFTHTLDDAEDAVQAASLAAIRRPDVIGTRARPWLLVVIRDEARRSRRPRELTLGDVDGEALAGDIDRVLDVRAALASLKPDERRALVGRAEGFSYCELAALNGWSYTKVNRCLTEGRAALRRAVCHG